MTQTISSTITDPGSETSVVRVWDPLVRVFHWTLVTCFAVAYFTEDDLLALHVWAGYAVFGLIAVRLFWGFVGPRHARWSDCVKEPREILAYQLNTIHNLHYFIGLMRAMREAIESDGFLRFRKNFYAQREESGRGAYND